MDYRKSFFHPFLHMWTKPYQTTTRVINENHRTSEGLLMYVMGVILSLNFFLNIAAGDSHSLLVIFGLSLAGGLVFGLLGWYVLSGIVYGMGKLFKGSASFATVKSALAWAHVPFVIQLIVLWPMNFYVFGSGLFTSAEVALSPLQMIVNLLKMIGMLILSIWYVVLLIRAVSAAQQFSGGKGFVVVLFSGVVVGFVFLAWLAVL